MISITLDKDGLYEYVYDIKEEETINLEVKKNVKATCIFIFRGTNFKINKQITLYSNSSLHILYRNKCEQYISDEVIKVHAFASINAGYFELEDHQAEINAVYELLAEEASANLITTTLANTVKAINIACEHHYAHTYSKIENYAINDAHGKLDIVASGSIKKGARGSKSHQSTRVLTLAEGNREKVKVTPLLLIDENDVEASHACGIGEMNEDHLYYLQTRGLSKKEALGLLTLSYFMPILEIVEHEEQIKTELELEIQRKVGL